MRTLKQSYELFGQLAGSRSLMEAAGLDPDHTSFIQICRHLKVCPGDLEELLMKDTGLCGDDVFK